MWQRHDEERALCESAVEIDQRMPEIDLRFAGWMTQGHEDFALGRLEIGHEFFNYRVAAVVTALIAKTFEEPLGRVALFARHRAISIEDGPDPLAKGIDLALRLGAPPVARRLWVFQHLLQRLPMETFFRHY